MEDDVNFGISQNVSSDFLCIAIYLSKLAEQLGSYEQKCKNGS